MNNKLETITNLFEEKEIRSVWDSKSEEYYFSVVDVISALTDSANPRKYWTVLKTRLKNEGSELTTKCSQLKMLALDGKMRMIDVLDTEGIFRLIESVPSKKAENFKLWLARLGKERVDEVFNPELAINRAVNYYRNKGYSDDWIKIRLTGIVDRLKLTDIWKENGINKPIEYALLTNEIYKTWSGMDARGYKDYKGLRKESLRDNMTNIESILTDLGEIATRDIAESTHPKGFEENMKVAKQGGSVANDARISYENATKKRAISNTNFLSYQYKKENNLIKGGEINNYE